MTGFVGHAPDEAVALRSELARLRGRRVAELVVLALATPLAAWVIWAAIDWTCSAVAVALIAMRGVEVFVRLKALIDAEATVAALVARRKLGVAAPAFSGSGGSGSASEELAP